MPLFQPHPFPRRGQTRSQFQNFYMHKSEYRVTFFVQQCSRKIKMEALHRRCRKIIYRISGVMFSSTNIYLWAKLKHYLILSWYAFAPIFYSQEFSSMDKEAGNTTIFRNSRLGSFEQCLLTWVIASATTKHRQAWWIPWQTLLTVFRTGCPVEKD